MIGSIEADQIMIDMIGRMIEDGALVKKIIMGTRGGTETIGEATTKRTVTIKKIDTEIDQGKLTYLDYSSDIVKKDQGRLT